MLKKVPYCIYYLGTVDNDYVASFEISELIPGGNFISLFLPCRRFIRSLAHMAYRRGQSGLLFHFLSLECITTAGGVRDSLFTIE